jgi:hypothetical protein
MARRIIILAILLAGLLVSSGLPLRTARAQEDPPPPEQPADPPAQAEPEPEPDDPSTADPQDPAGGEVNPDKEQDEKIRPRHRPSSDEEERTYKRQATRNDPFLNPLIRLSTEPSEAGGYNPRDHILKRGYNDLQRFVVQNAEGKVQGFLTIHSKEEELPLLGRVMNIVKLCEYEPSCRIEMQVQLDALQPNVTQIIRTDENRSQAALDLQLQESLRAEYLFDRVTIRQNVSGITGLDRERMLPFSFDIMQMDSLVRSLNFGDSDWPLEAWMFDPERRMSVPLMIEAPSRVQMTSAEPVIYQCWEIRVRVGNETWTYWLERLDPNRIVRFSDPRHTYTLMSYTQGQ